MTWQAAPVHDSEKTAPPASGTSNAYMLGYRALVFASVATGVVLLALLLCYAAKVFLLVFASVLVAVVLRGVSDWISRHTFLPPGWALFLTVALLLLLTTLLGWVLANQIQSQVNDLVEQTSRRLHSAWDYIQSHGYEQYFQELPQSAKQALSDSDALRRGTSGLVISLGLVLDILLVLFLGLFFAIEPDRYVSGLLHLIPVNKRPRARDVLDTLRTTLGWWFIGRLSSMTVVAVLATLGLWSLGVPLAPTLGFLSGLLTFVPNFGIVIATLFATLFGLSASPATGLYVVLLYLAIGMLEGNVLTPLIQQRAVALPAGVLLAAQLLLGTLLGVLGVLLACPLTAAISVIVRKVYVKDILGDTSVK